LIKKRASALRKKKHKKNVKATRLQRRAVSRTATPVAGRATRCHDPANAGVRAGHKPVEPLPASGGV